MQMALVLIHANLDSAIELKTLTNFVTILARQGVIFTQMAHVIPLASHILTTAKKELMIFAIIPAHCLHSSIKMEVVNLHAKLPLLLEKKEVSNSAIILARQGTIFI